MLDVALKNQKMEGKTVKSREEIVAEMVEIIKGLSMFGVLKIWWIAKYIRDKEKNPQCLDKEDDRK